MKPLEGIIVLDMSRVLAGPYCTMLLSELGARVIKIERPIIGDDSRCYGPFKNEKSAYFVSVNREKESITVDLTKPEGREIIKRFVNKADVLVENFRPGIMEKWGLGWDELCKINPALIYASSSGFGQTGPWAQKPAYDMIVQAMGGIMSITGWPDSPPTRVGMSIGDIVTALFTAIGITSALYQRTISGVGQKIDVAMLDCQLSILENAFIRYLFEGKSPTPLGTRHPTITPFQAFKTADSWLIVAIGNDKLWNTFCSSLELEELKNDARFKTNKSRCENFDELLKKLEPLFIQKPSEFWIEILEKNAIPCTPIAKMEDVVKNPQLKVRNMFVDVNDKDIGSFQITGNPIKMSMLDDRTTRNPAPQLGENTKEVLENLLGYTKMEIDNFKNQNII